MAEPRGGLAWTYRPQLCFFYLQFFVLLVRLWRWLTLGLMQCFYNVGRCMDPASDSVRAALISGRLLLARLN